MSSSCNSKAAKTAAEPQQPTRCPPGLEEKPRLATRSALRARQGREATTAEAPSGLPGRSGQAAQCGAAGGPTPASERFATAPQARRGDSGLSRFPPAVVGATTWAPLAAAACARIADYAAPLHKNGAAPTTSGAASRGTLLFIKAGRARGVLPFVAGTRIRTTSGPSRRCQRDAVAATASTRCRMTSDRRMSERNRSTRAGAGDDATRRGWSPAHRQQFFDPYKEDPESVDGPDARTGLCRSRSTERQGGAPGGCASLLKGEPYGDLDPSQRCALL